MPHIAFIGVALFRGTAFNGTLAYDLSAVQEAVCLFVKELHGGYLFKLTLFVEGGDESVGEFGVYLLRPAEAGSSEEVRCYTVFVEGLLLFVVVALYELFKGSLKLALCDLLSPSLGDRRTVAVCTADEYYIFTAYAVTEKTCISICKHEHSAHMAEMEFLISVGHTACDYCPFREFGAGYLKRHFIAVFVFSHYFTFFPDHYFLL